MCSTWKASCSLYFLFVKSCQICMNCGAPPKWYSTEAWNSNSEYLKPHCSASSSQRWQYSKMSRGTNKLFQMLKSIFCWERLCQRQVGVSPKFHPFWWAEASLSPDRSSLLSTAIHAFFHFHKRTNAACRSVPTSLDFWTGVYLKLMRNLYLQTHIDICSRSENLYL